MQRTAIALAGLSLSVLATAQDATLAQPDLAPVRAENGLPGKKAGTERWLVQFKRRSFDLEAFRQANLDNKPADVVAPIVAGLEARMKADQAPFAKSVQELGGEVVAQWWIVNGCAIEVPPAVLEQIRKHPNVVRIEPDRMFEPVSILKTPAPFILTATNANNHNADAVQAAGIKGAGVGCAIMDTGQDSSTTPTPARPHATYLSEGNLGINSGGIGGSRLQANKQIGAMVADDVQGHGTGVAGIAAGGKWNALANSDHGHAPQADIIGYAISDDLAGSASSATITTAWNTIAADKAAFKIVTANNSYSGSPDPLNMMQQALDSCAHNANILIACAAGNSGASTATSQSVANGLAVAAASADTKVIAGFSSKGPLSGDPARFYPDITGCGVNTVMPRRDNEADPTGFVASGTSMASPQICGAATLYRHRKPAASALETKAALLATTENISIQNPALNRNAYGLGFLRDDRLIDVANGNAVIYNSTLTTTVLSRSFSALMPAAGIYSVVLAWNRQNMASTSATWTNMRLQVNASSSDDPHQLYERVIIVAAAAGLLNITVSAPALEAGQASVAFSVVIPGAKPASFGVNCKGFGDPLIGISGLPTVGSTNFAVTLTGTRPGALALLYLSSIRADAPSGPCTIYPSTQLGVTLNTMTNGLGNAAIPMPLPYSPWLLPLPMYCQWMIVDPGGPISGYVSLSDGLLVVAN